MKIYNEYVSIYLNEIQQYIVKGYEPIHFYIEHSSYQENKDIYGNFMGNSITLNIPINKSSIDDKVVMGRQTAAKLLYEKGLNENNS